MTKKILIVDDEVHIRTLLEQTLEDLEDDGVEILTGANGHEGLEIVRAERPDVVFLDVMMPKLSGFDVCEAIKNDQSTAATFVVMLTAKGQQADRAQGEALGADVFATKPFDPDAMVDIARKALGLA
ncbi:MAG: response regulator [Actinomycetota bacterium]